MKKIKFITTEEMVVKKFENKEIPYRCMRVELWFHGENYKTQVGYVRLPYEIFQKVRTLIEREYYIDENI